MKPKQYMRYATALGVAAVMAPSVAYSSFLDVNLFDNQGNVQAESVRTFDWGGGATGVAVGKGPFGSNPFEAPNPFDFFFQTRLVDMVDSAGDSRNFTGEYTLTMQLTQLATPTDDPSAARFTPLSGVVSIWFDDFSEDFGGQEALQSTGAGYADGVEILRLSYLSGDSTFFLRDEDQGDGVANNLQFALLDDSDFINTSYITGLNDMLEFGLRFQSTQNYPADVQTPPGWFLDSSDPDLWAPYEFDADNDLRIQIDASNTYFAREVPEPAGLLLFGIGVIGVAFAVRRTSRSRYVGHALHS